MKQKIFIAAFIFMSISVFSVKAQNMKGNAGCKGDYLINQLPNLTETQKTSISDIRTKHLKVFNTLKIQKNEKQAHLQTLKIQDTPDQKAIDKSIDEITAIQNQMMKNRMAMHMEIRKLLTDEQKVYFDKHTMNRKKGCHGHKKYMN